MELEITKLLRRRRWQRLGSCLQQGVTDAQFKFAIEAVCRNAPESDIITHILPHCVSEKLEYLVDLVMQYNLWETLHEILLEERYQIRYQWTVLEACEHATEQEIIDLIIPCCTYEKCVAVLIQLVKRRMPDATNTMLQKLVGDTFLKWINAEQSEELDDRLFCQLVQSYRDNGQGALHDLVKMTRLGLNGCDYFQSELPDFQREIPNLDTTLFRGVFAAALWIIMEICFGDPTVKGSRGTMEEQAYSWTSLVQNEIASLSVNQSPVSDDVIKRVYLCMAKSFFEDFSAFHDPFFQVFVIKYLLKRDKDCNLDLTPVLLIMCTVPCVPDVQSIALRVMLLNKRWDVIGLADMTLVWENVRRDLFRAAVEQQQWSIVKKWSDHTLYDDIRIWAIRKAFEEKQWDTVLQLTDYGLTDTEMARMHFNIAKCADWKTVLRMFKRGVDITEMKERLQRAFWRKTDNDHPKNDRVQAVKKLEEREKQTVKQKVLQKRLKWRTAFFQFLHGPVENSNELLKTAIKKRAWRVVSRLVRLGLTLCQQNKLFRRMVACKQWGVCRTLLDCGVDVRSCVAVIPHFIKMNQWVLLSKIMEYNVGDDERRRIMQLALERREGSVVWQCISNLQEGLSQDERKRLFKRAFHNEIWQALKPLIEFKDPIGIHHRDTVLLEAIKQHQWDVVDHCQRFHADINMKDENGETPVQRAARGCDWEAVEELVQRDADPSALDTNGYTALHRAINAKQWETVKILVQFQADIHKTAKAETNHGPDRQTPLQKLIGARQGKIIGQTLLWCPDQGKAVNEEGETTLHAVCLSGEPTDLYYLIARGADPLAVTENGESVLMSAVQSKTSPQRMVAECIQLGLSTHQPFLTSDESETPFEYALTNKCIVEQMFIVAQMLYESGSCSNKEQFKLLSEYQPHEHAISGKSLSYLQHVATKPRSLASTCRLVISHCFTIRGKRHRDIHYLAVPESVKKYLLFTDLTDPNYGRA